MSFYQKKLFQLLVVLGTGATFVGSAKAQSKGPSSSQTPYDLPVSSGWRTTSILTTGDSVPLTGSTSGQTYRMAGVPDGLGAFANADGKTFTVLMNHEIAIPNFAPFTSTGYTRAQGGYGAFVSEWVIDKATLKVISGQDSLYQVQYAYRRLATNEMIPPTMAYLKRVAVCDTRRADRACPKVLPNERP